MIFQTCCGWSFSFFYYCYFIIYFFIHFLIYWSFIYLTSFLWCFRLWTVVIPSRYKIFKRILYIEIHYQLIYETSKVVLSVRKLAALRRQLWPVQRSILNSDENKICFLYMLSLNLEARTPKKQQYVNVQIIMHDQGRSKEKTILNDLEEHTVIHEA